MNLIEWLRKLGILRFGGVAKVYHNAKDRPVSFQMHGVYDEEKDLVHFKKKDKTPPDADKPSQ
jgi:hypothetical protein